MVSIQPENFVVADIVVVVASDIVVAVVVVIDTIGVAVVNTTITGVYDLFLTFQVTRYETTPVQFSIRHLST